MASGQEIRMEASKVNLITQLLTAALSMLQDAVVITQPSIQTTKPARRKRDPARTNGKNAEDHDADKSRYGGTVVPIGPLLRSPIDSDKEYPLDFVAKYLDVSGQTVRKRINDGSLTAEKRGNGRGAWYITGEELIRFSNLSTTGDDT